MSKLIKSTFSNIFNLGSYFVRKATLIKEEGARFATSNEISQIFSSGNKGILVDGDKYRLTEKDSFEHLAVIAKPGSGKSTAFIIPAILDLANKHNSIIVNDPSSEVYELTSGHMANSGYRVQRLTPERIEASDTFNPFDGLGKNDFIEIEQICESIVLSKYQSEKDALWNDGAIQIIEVIAKCLAFSQPQNLNLAEINNQVMKVNGEGQGLDEWIIDNGYDHDNDDNSLVLSWLSITNASKRMFANYLTICKTCLKQMGNPQIQHLLSSSTIKLDKLREQKTIVYLNFPEANLAYYQFIIDMFYTKLFAVAMKRRPASHEYSLFCFLDEFGNSYVKDFSVIANNVRKYRVSLSIVLQGITQLDAKYGKDQALAIQAGIGSFLIYRGGDVATTDRFADIAGQKNIQQREVFSDITISYTSLNLLSANELRTLGDNQAFFISKNRHPFVIEFTNYFNSRRFTKLTKIMPAKQEDSQIHFDTKLNI